MVYRTTTGAKRVGTPRDVRQRSRPSRSRACNTPVESVTRIVYRGPSAVPPCATRMSGRLQRFAPSAVYAYVPICPVATMRPSGAMVGAGGLRKVPDTGRGASAACQTAPTLGTATESLGGSTVSHDTWVRGQAPSE